MNVLAVAVQGGCLVNEWNTIKRQRKREREAAAGFQELHGRITWKSLPHPAWMEFLLGKDSFDHVERVDLSFREITDSEFDRIKSMTGLEHLWLRNTQVTDAGLTRLSALSSLRELKLSSDKITDEGMKYLRRLEKLEELELSGHGITDVGLDQLRELHNLQTVRLIGVHATTEGIQKLQQALKCQIQYSLDHVQ
jgi:Leucine-rich repeat (LRR) protein